MSDVKHIASVSFGKDSLAMILRLLEEEYPLDAVVFYDTGMEFEAIYRLRDAVTPMIHERGIEFVELCPKEPFLFSMFEREVKYRNKPGCHYGYGWCGSVCRWGTHGKLDTISTYKKSLGDSVTDYVGIAADEPQRFSKAKAEGKVLPLVDWGMTERDCLNYCHDHGFYWYEGDVELYSILSRVSCWCCRNKNLAELRNIYHFLPEYWDKLRGLQERIESPMKGESGSVFDLERRFSMEDEWLAQGKKINTAEFFSALREGERIEKISG